VKIVHALIVKSLAETLLVSALAVGFYLRTFPPTFQGWGEAIDNQIAGWAVDQAEQSKPLTVQLFVDGNLISAAVANRARPDIVLSGWARDAAHGYSFAVPGLSPGLHEARIFVLHQATGNRQTLQLLGDPIEFRVDEQGTFYDLTKRAAPYSVR
jgi:hypothetical protein